MKTYKFPLFDVEIIDPIVEIVKKSRPDLDSDEITMDVILVTDTARKGITLRDIICPDRNTADYMQLAINALEEFAVKTETPEE